MIIGGRIWQFTASIIAGVGMLVSCTTIPILEVTYRLPPESDVLKGQEIYLHVKDSRGDINMIGEGAKEDFEHFSGNISFSVVQDTTPQKVGVFDASSLFREAFKERLKRENIQVSNRWKKGGLEMEVALKTFFLDLKDRKWVVKMAYEARLFKDGRLLSSQIIEGQGERLKVVGRGQSNIIAGEVFTDMVNRLDLIRLFQQAGL
jgi:hypothetical protein